MNVMITTGNFLFSGKIKKALKLVVLSFFIVNPLFSQKWQPQVICSNDTIILDPYINPYRALECKTSTNISSRWEFAISRYLYTAQTQEWMKNHGGPNFSLALGYSNVSIGIRFKPWTINPEKELEFEGIVLPETADVNNVRIDYYASYSFDFNNLISVEPYVGLNRTLFFVINEDELNQTYDLNSTGGLIFGTSINQYFYVGNFSFLVLFATLGYGFVNYDKLHPELGNGYFEWSIGIALKSFRNHRFYKRVDD